MNIKDFMEAIQYKVTGGSPYEWRCYGPDARFMDCENLAYFSISMVFDSEDQTIYEIQAWDDVNNRQYRWINPEFIDALKDETASRNMVFETSLDDNKFIDLEVDEDILEKITAIVNGKSYDTRVVIPLDLDNEELLKLMTYAHEADMTFNDYVAKMLTEEVIRLSGNQ
jgi:hypothetical protein